MPESAGLTWEVGSQLEKPGQDASGNFVPGMEVHFTTGNGVAGSVWVPLTQYNAGTVRDLIAARVAAIESVSKLNG